MPLTLLDILLGKQSTKRSVKPPPRRQCTSRPRPRPSSVPRCFRCGGGTRLTGFRHAASGKPIRACKGCGRTFISKR